MSACGDAPAPAAGAASAPPSPAVTSAAPSPTPAVDGGPALAKAVAASVGSDFTFALSSGGASTSGEYDAESKGTRMLPGQSGGDAMEFVAIGDDLWVQVEAGTYLHYSAAKFTARHQMIGATAPVAALDFLGAASGVTVDGAGEYKGTIDLAKVPRSNPAAAHLAALLAERIGATPVSSAVPFTAKLDAQGRINKVTVDLPHAENNGSNLVYGFTAYDYGKQISVGKPTGRIVDAPMDAYA
ncbi:hypothetical protein [Dactylosporangium sp. NPDC051541]|uniref:hypothetical protein n=1 Tax=Dactylosporangium sp. NPDC051541 TaxID=3363977 RepID=UPI0037A1F698